LFHFYFSMFFSQSQQKIHFWLQHFDHVKYCLTKMLRT
jgi:hypothetical protein